MNPTLSASSVDGTQTTGITESDARIWAEMMTETSIPSVPSIIMRTTSGYVGWCVRWIEREN